MWSSTICNIPYPIAYVFGLMVPYSGYVSAGLNVSQAVLRVLAVVKVQLY